MSLSSWLTQVQWGKLSPTERGKLEQLITQYPNVLTENLSLTNLVECEIQMLETTAVRLAPYRLAPPKLHYLWELTKVLLRDGFIGLSLSNYSSPMFLVLEPGGIYRSVVDYRLLNKRTAIESVPLPDTHSAFHRFARAKYFTTR